jgi:arylsulfatase
MPAKTMAKQTTRREFLWAAGMLAPGARAVSALAAAAAPRRPNFLLLFPDQLRFDWIGNPAIPARTPNLDRLRRRGTHFRRAVVASPLCAPSRACLASGKEYDRAGVGSNAENYPLAQTTYYTLLRNSGYHVAGCGKFDLHKGTPDWGLDGKRLLPEWGFSDGIDNAGKMDAISSGAREPKDPYMAYLHERKLAAAHVEDFRTRAKIGHSATFPTPLPEEAYCDNWLSNNGLELMQRFPQGKPWHLVVNFTCPHPPWDITERMERLCRGRQFPQPNRCAEFTPETHAAIRQNYTAMIENIDRWAGLFLDEVEKRGELDNTVIAFSSDHGEMLGDHSLWGKTLPYQPSVGVPLIVAGPGVRKGVWSDALVSVMDLAATFLDYAGVARPADMDSRSFRPVLEDKTRSHREYVLSGLGRWRLVADNRYKLIRGYGPNARVGERTAATAVADVPPLLFDVENDPLENEDIAAKAEKEVRRLSALLRG